MPCQYCCKYIFIFSWCFQISQPIELAFYEHVILCTLNLPDLLKCWFFKHHKKQQNDDNKFSNKEYGDISWLVIVWLDFFPCSELLYKQGYQSLESRACCPYCAGFTSFLTLTKIVLFYVVFLVFTLYSAGTHSLKYVPTFLTMNKFLVLTFSVLVSWCVFGKKDLQQFNKTNHAIKLCIFYLSFYCHNYTKILLSLSLLLSCFNELLTF